MIVVTGDWRRGVAASRPRVGFWARDGTLEWQVSQPHMRDRRFLQVAEQRYKAFLHLFKITQSTFFLVPTYDIDLMWHAHQRSPLSYRQDMLQILGRVLDHDDTDSDRTAGHKLDEGFKITRDIWHSAFGILYEHAGAMHRGEPPAPVLPVPPYFPTMEVAEGTPAVGLQQNSRLLSRQIMQVSLTILGAKNVPTKRKGMLRVRLQFESKCSALRVETVEVPLASDPQWNHHSSFECETSTRGLRLGLLLRRSNSFKQAMFGSKLIGTMELQWHKVLASPTLSFDGWYPLFPDSNLSSSLPFDPSKPPSLLISVSVTPPQPGPHLLRIINSIPTDENGCMDNTYSGRHGIWLTRTVLDHANRDIFIIRISYSDASTPGKPTSEKQMYIHQGGWEYHSQNSDRGTAPVNIVASAQQLAEMNEGSDLRRRWTLLDDNAQLTVVKDAADSLWNTRPALELTGNLGDPIRLVCGRMLEYEVKGATEEEEGGFVTVIRYNPKDAPFGKATALFNWRSGAMEAGRINCSSSTLKLFWPSLQTSKRNVCQVGGINECIDSFETAEALRKLCESGELHEALKVLDLMCQQRIPVSTTMFYCLLQVCIIKKDLQAGTEVHWHVARCGLEGNAFLGSHLIRMFASCGNLLAASQVFSRLHEPTLFTWSAIILAHANLGQAEKAIQLYHQMRRSALKPNEYIFVAVLKACGSTASLSEGRFIHADIVGESLKYDLVERSLESDLFVSTALINMYAKCGNLEDAHMIFEKLKTHSVVTWNALIAGYAQHGCGEEALQYFHQMQQCAGICPDAVSFISVLKACSIIQALHQGKSIHVQISGSGFHSDLFVRSALIDMYAKCECLDDARRVFDKIPARDVVTWNAMIAGYAQNGHGQDALQLFMKMLQLSIKPSNVTFVSSLKACSSIVALDEGRRIHAFFAGSCFQLDLFVGNTLVDMYAKCGSLEDACRVFEEMIERDVITWTAIIAGYAQDSNYMLAFKYFEDMQNEGVKPADVTYLCLLSACSRGSLVKEGLHHFKSMSAKHGITPTPEHYYCMVDLFGRAGQLKEAEKVLESIPYVGTHVVAWKSLLSHCRTHGDVLLGKQCFEIVAAVDCRDSSVYVLMSNIYADAGMFEDALKIEDLRKCAEAWKKPGKACIEVYNTTYDFVVADKCHSESHNIYGKLKQLSVSIKEEGYVPCLESVLHLTSDEANEDDLSENLIYVTI